MPTDPARRFLWLFLPVVAAVVVIGGFWFMGRSPHARDRSYAKDHPIGFLAANSAGEAILQLDVCLLQYALVKGDDAFPDDLADIGPDGIRCASADISGGASRLNYRFAYYPTTTDAKGKARGFLLYAYPLLMPNGQPPSDSTVAEYFASEEGLVLVRKDFGTAKEHIEPFLGMPKTLQVLSARLVAGSRLPTDQPGILTALGPQGSPGYSTVPKGYQGLWTPEDNDAVVVWTNLSEGYLYSYHPEHSAAPAHFTLLARPVHLGIAGVDAPIRRIRHYFLNEAGGVHTTFLGREATALDPEVASCERSGENCEQVWVAAPTGSRP
ncbi:MAG TPA: hypothetical protein VJO16_18725 [Candidatus Acidoferrum sp.]|nr:hypothetical protein [Candidatus Acidoferrum sp.]